MHPVRLLLSALCCGTVLLLGWSVAGAPAAGPAELEQAEGITDRAGVLHERESEVRRALDRLHRQQRLRLHVVYVGEFAGRDAQGWADATAKRSGLGSSDVLLAVATGERSHAVHAPPASGLTEDTLAQVSSIAIEPALREEDWSGAAIGAAHGYAAALSGNAIPGPLAVRGEEQPGRTTGTGGGSVLLPLLLVGSAAALGVLLYSRGRREDGRAGTGRRPAPAGGGPPAARLETAAREALIELDDAVRTSIEELGWAEARAGAAAARPFRDAAGAAARETTAAFRLRLRLDEAGPRQPEDERRRALNGILRSCATAARYLDDAAVPFARLRDLTGDPASALREARRRREAAGERVSDAASDLDGLMSRYAIACLAPVRDHPREAEARLAFAAGRLADADRAVEAGDRHRAAAAVRAAESAVDQAELLAGAVGRRAAELRAAEQEVLRAREAAAADLTRAREAAARGAGPGALREAADRTAELLRQAEDEPVTGGREPFAAVRRLLMAGAALSDALDGVRAPEAGRERSRELLELALLVVQGELAAAQDFVTTHRGRVGCPARTALSEAERCRARAAAVTSQDPRSALRLMLGADALARQAYRLAQQDGGRRSPAGENGAPRRRNSAVAADGGSGEAMAREAGILLPDGTGVARFGGPGSRMPSDGG